VRDREITNCEFGDTSDLPWPSLFSEERNVNPEDWLIDATAPLASLAFPADDTPRICTNRIDGDQCSFV
jgi:hypothetical protein